MDFVPVDEDTKLVMSHWNGSNAYEIKYLNRDKAEISSSLKTGVPVDPNDNTKGTYDEVAAKAYELKIKINAVLTADELAALTEAGTTKVQITVTVSETSDARIYVWGSTSSLEDGAAKATGGLTFTVNASSLTTDFAGIGYVAVSYEGNNVDTSGESPVNVVDSGAPTITLVATGELHS